MLGLVGVQAFTPHATQHMCLQEDASTQQEDEENKEAAESSAAGTASKDVDTDAEESQMTQQHVWHHDCSKVSTLCYHQYAVVAVSLALSKQSIARGSLPRLAMPLWQI